jgi:Tautomerase enzyme
MPRGQELKLKFHNELCRELKKSCDIEASDVMVSMVTNSAPDWSFGNGTAQFVTGEL